MEFPRSPSLDSKKLRRAAKLGSIFAIAGVITGLSRIDIHVKTRIQQAMDNTSEPSTEPSHTRIMQASTFPLPSFSLSVDGKALLGDDDSTDSAPLTIPTESGLDIPVNLDKPVTCPDGSQLCNIGYGPFPYCLIPNEQCLNALTEMFNFYPKNVESPVTSAAATTSTPSSGSSWINPFSDRKILDTTNKGMNSSHTTSHSQEANTTAAQRPSFVNWDHRGKLTVVVPEKTDETSQVEANISKQSEPEISQLESLIPPALALPLFQYIGNPDRTTPLNKDQVTMMMDLGKKILDEKFVAKFIKASGVKCSDVVDVFSIFINEQLAEAQKQGKSLEDFAKENPFLVMILAQQLGFEKMPKLNQWVWMKIPPYLIEEKVCGASE